MDSRKVIGQKKEKHNRIESSERGVHICCLLIRTDAAIANTWKKDGLFNKKNWINFISEWGKGKF